MLEKNLVSMTFIFVEQLQLYYPTWFAGFAFHWIQDMYDMFALGQGLQENSRLVSGNWKVLIFEMTNGHVVFIN